MAEIKQFIKSKTDKTKIYPRTLARAVYMGDGKTTVEESLDNNVQQLNNKINEVATTGTTIEIVQNKVEEMAEQGLIQAYTLGDKTVEPKKTTFFTSEVGINKFNINAVGVERDKVLQSDGSYYSPMNGFIISDYIEVPAYQQAVVTFSNSEGGARESDNTGGIRFLCVYDENKSVISAEGSNSGVKYYTNLTDKKRYIRFSYNSTTKFNVMCEVFSVYINYTKASGFNTYYPYSVSYKFIDNLLSDYVLNAIKKVNTLYFTGKSLLTIGDSITYQNKWQPYVISELGFSKHYNFGYSGFQSWQIITDEHLATFPASVDVIILMVGTNDWAQSNVLGNITDTNNVGFSGNIYNCIKKLYAKYPTSEIILMGCPYGLLPNNLEFKNNGRNNKLDLSTLNYHDRTKEICNLYNVRFIDNCNLGWNYWNKETYIQNDGGWLHPNDLGGKVLGNNVIGYLNKNYNV